MLRVLKESLALDKSRRVRIDKAIRQLRCEQVEKRPLSHHSHHNLTQLVENSFQLALESIFCKPLSLDKRWRPKGARVASNRGQFVALLLSQVTLPVTQARHQLKWLSAREWSRVISFHGSDDGIGPRSGGGSLDWLHSSRQPSRSGLVSSQVRRSKVRETLKQSNTT